MGVLGGVGAPEVKHQAVFIQEEEAVPLDRIRCPAEDEDQGCGRSPSDL